MWRQGREVAGAVMCEPRASFIKWPQWHTLIFEGEARVDMIYCLPKRREENARATGWSVYCKKWAAKHEYEELKEGIWLELALDLLRKKKTKEEWTEEQQGVAKKIVSGRRRSAQKTFRHWLVG